MTNVPIPPATMSTPGVGTFMTVQEAFIHGFCGAPYGDLEFDVGKSVHWMQYFTDDLYITDVNLGTPRYWIVNWSLTFPDAYHDVTGINFFERPVEFRKAQYEGALGETNGILLEDNDWILFIDAHEGLCCDARSLPNDHLTEPFKAYIYREITRAEDSSADNVVFPFFAFLRDGDIKNVQYEHPAFDDPTLGLANPTAVQSVSCPYYLVTGKGLPRLWKVSSIKDPSFDWSQLDTLIDIPDDTVKVSLISYAYAHWNLQDIEPPETTVPPLDANNDDGWRMRNLISRVRPLTGLPTGAWQDPSTDPAGDPGVWAGEQPNAPEMFEDDGTGTDTLVPAVMPSPTADTEMLTTPMYDTIFRLNMRDGVWYYGDNLGNVPLAWDDDTQTWVPRDMSPEDWHESTDWVAPA